MLLNLSLSNNFEYLKINKKIISYCIDSGLILSICVWHLSRGYKMKRIILFLSFFIIALDFSYAQLDLLSAGPLVGYSAMREVAIWVQTTDEAEVHIEYWNVNNKNDRFTTKTETTYEDDAYTAKLIADEVEPGQKYNYELYINDIKVERPYPLQFQTQKLWQWREDPPEFSFITGSCLYINEPQYDRPGTPYGSDYEILKSIYQKHPDFIVWLGDNLYLREADWDSWTGIIKRYTHDRAFDLLQPIFGSIHNYAIWDDHDYGPDNSDRSFWNKDDTYRAFQLFWPNPSFGINGNPGITTYFQWADCDFYLMDDRYYRSPDKLEDSDKQMLGDEQIEWLIDAMSTSEAPFKFVCIGGQVLNPAGKGETYYEFPAEKKKLLDKIKQAGIKGVIFLTGDRHHSEISKLDREGTYPLYDFTISSFTAGISPGKNEANTLRVPGTLSDQHNFAKITISGKSKNRVLKCVDYDKDGKQLWEYTINENELK